jgi:hypothetical protein
MKANEGFLSAGWPRFKSESAKVEPAYAGSADALVRIEREARTLSLEIRTPSEMSGTRVLTVAGEGACAPSI